MSAPERPVLEVTDLGVRFGGRHGPVQVVADVSLTVGRGETLALVGESGSGKTITSMALMGLLPARRTTVTGQALLAGRDLLALGRRELDALRGGTVSMIFQEPMSSLNPAFTVGEQIAETIRLHRALRRREAFRAAIASMDAVGIPRAAERATAYPHEFSGGMRQRVMIAMAVSCEPSLLIADEPTTALDVTVQAQILQLLRDLQDAHGMGMILVTHDLAVVAETADRVAVMYGGSIVEQGPTEELFTRPRHPYLGGLLRSMPSGSRHGRASLYSIGGTPPSPEISLPGCRFAPRCAFAQEECNTVRPVVESIDEVHEVRCLRASELELAVTSGVR